MTKKSPLKIATSEWKTQHAEIIQILNKMGFNLDEKTEEFTEYLFFERVLTFNMDLGSDIKDETLEPPQSTTVLNHQNPLLDKYDINLAEYDPFYEWKIERKQSFNYIVNIRLRIQTSIGGFNNLHIGVFTSKNVSPLPPIEKEWKVDSFEDINTVKSILEDIDRKITITVTLISNGIPDKIQIARMVIENKKQKLAKAITNMKARQFLIGALQQFDALQP